MTQVLRGNIVHAPAMGRLDILEHGCLVLEDGVITGLYPDLPAHLEGAEVRDFGDRIIMQSFADMHLHAPQYPMLGMGMDLPLLDWLNTYTFFCATSISKSMIFNCWKGIPFSHSIFTIILDGLRSRWT